MKNVFGELVSPMTLLEVIVLGGIVALILLVPTW